MALIRCDHFSDVLEQGTTTTVVLPQPSATQIGATVVGSDSAPPVLYLLHGLSDDSSAWLRYTSIERYATAAGLAVVMPQVHRSFYTDLPRDGGAYWTYLSQELPEVVHRFFRVSDRREETFVAGLSMGGFGAYKWAMAQPERFAAAASLSGAVDLADLIALDDRGPLFESVLAGRTLAETGNDLIAAAAALDPATAPAFYLACGTEDERLLPGNRNMERHLSELGLDLTSSFSPGDHEWDYWDARIADVIAWLPLDRSASAR